MSYSVIIPVHNVYTRGYERLRFQLISIAKQTRKVTTVFVPDSTTDIKNWENSDIICRDVAQKYGINIDHFYVETGGIFNMPVKFNRSLEKVKSDYVLCTGVDFIYGPTLFESYGKYQRTNRFILKVVWNLPNITLNSDHIDRWNIPGRKKRHPAGQGADGIQYAHIDTFYELGGYDERMAGWGGMDNDLHRRAEKLEGCEVLWMEKGQIFHIWHKVEKGGADDMKQTYKNWNILDNDPTIKRNFLK